MDNNDLEIEQLLKKLREKKRETEELTQEMEKQDVLEKQKKEAETVPVAVPYSAPEAPQTEETAENADTEAEEPSEDGAFRLRTQEKQDDGKISRSLRELLTAPAENDEKKGMLAPNIERGFDAEPEEPEEQEEPEPVREPETRQIDPAAHPLFTTPVTQSVELSGDRPKMKSGFVPAEADAGLRLDDDAKRRGEEGVINVKEKVDDEFREFFGDTVIIDRQPLDAKQTRQRRIKDFVISKDGETGGPVFDDDADTRPEEESGEEYRSEEDTEPILAELSSRRAAAVLAVLFGGAASLALFALNLGSWLEIGVFTAISASVQVFSLINAALMLIACVINVRRVGKGLAQLFTFRCESEALVAFAALAGVAEPVARFTMGADTSAMIAPVIASAALFCASVGDLVFVNGVLANFKSISTGFEKYASYIPDDEQLHRRVAKGLETDTPLVLLKRKTGFTDNFLHYAFSRDSASAVFRLPPSVLMIVSLACGVIGYFRAGPEGALNGVVVAASLGTTLLSTYKSALPLDKMQRSAARFGAVVPGFEAAERVGAANVVLMEGREMFPKGSVLLHGIKTFEKERIDRAILYAASICIPVCETLSPLFYNVIQGKTEMLYHAENIEYENGLGFTCWVDKSRVLLGTREMMAAHGVAVPNMDFEIRYTKTRSRDAIYLAVGGDLYAMFVVSYTLSTEVEEVLHGFEREGISVAVRTNDFNVTPKKIGEIFSLPQSMFTVLRAEETALLSDATGYASHSDSLLNHIGSLISYSKGIFACNRLQGWLRLTNTVTLLSMCIGAVLALAVTALGAAGSITLPMVLIFHALWLIVVTALSKTGRY